MDNKLGNYIRDKRKEKEVTLRKLAENSGLSFSHLSKLERGEHMPSKETLDIVSDALELDKYEIYLLAGYSTDADMEFWEELFKNLPNDWGIKKEDFLDPSGNPDVIKFRNSMVHGTYLTNIHNKLNSYFLSERLPNLIRKSATENDNADENLQNFMKWDRMNRHLEERGYTPETVTEIVELFERLDYQIDVINKKKTI